MATILYPSEAPVDQVTRVIDIIKDGNYRERASEFAKAGWVVVGYLQRVSLGDPDVSDAAGPPVLPAECKRLDLRNDEQCCEALMQCCASGGEPIGGFDWRLIINPQLVRWLLAKLADILEATVLRK